MSLENKKQSAKSKQQFYLKRPYLYLVTPDKLSKRDLLHFPLVETLNDFYEQMKKEDRIDYKILGLCLKSAARLHRLRVSSAIGFQRKLDSKYEKEQEESRTSFVSDQPLKDYINKLNAPPQNEPTPEAFYDKLMISMHSKEKKRKRQKKTVIIEEETKVEDLEPPEEASKTKKPRRRRKIRVKETVAFDAITVEFDRIEITELINQVLLIIRKLSINLEKDQEIAFNDILREKVTEDTDIARLRLEQVRTFISLLYLIMDEHIEAWQDLDTSNISIKITEKGKNFNFDVKSYN